MKSQTVRDLFRSNNHSNHAIKAGPIETACPQTVAATPCQKWRSVELSFGPSRGRGTKPFHPKGRALRVSGGARQRHSTKHNLMVKGKLMESIEKFAARYRLKISRDACNDPIINGRRGHLYFADGELCLMVLDGAPAIKSRWAALGGKLWAGDISPHSKTGRRVQDVKITGIPLENSRFAIRMAGCKAKRILSEAQKAALAKAQNSSPLRAQMQPQRLESFGKPSSDLEAIG